MYRENKCINHSYDEGSSYCCVCTFHNRPGENVIHLVSLVTCLNIHLQAAQIQNGYIAIPLCFPNGFPTNARPPPINSCYQEGFLGSIPSRFGPCLVPIIQGYAVPPCNGNHYRLASFAAAGK